MNAVIRKWTMAVSLIAGVAGAALTAPAAAADEKAEAGDQSPDTLIVTSPDDAPRYGRREVKKALEQLGEDHRLQITTGQFFDSGHSSSTNEFEPFVASMVPVNKEGEKDGVERFLPEPRAASRSRSVTWVEGVKHGPERIYDKRGNVIEEIPWVEGKIHGVRRTFDADGNVRSVAHYEQGVQTGVGKSFDSEGNLLREVTYKDGRKHGKRVDYWAETGDPKRVVPYRNGRAHGEVVEYHRNGEVKMRVQVMEGQLHGKQEVFSERGKLRDVRYWWEGSSVSHREFEAKQKRKGE